MVAGLEFMEQTGFVHFKAHSHGIHEAWNVFVCDDDTSIWDHDLFDNPFARENFRGRCRATACTQAKEHPQNKADFLHSDEWASAYCMGENFVGLRILLL